MVLWENERYLPGLVDCSYCCLKVSLRCFCVWRTRCKKTVYLCSGQNVVRTVQDSLQFRVQKVYMTSVHYNKVKWKLLCLFLYASNWTTERDRDPLIGQPGNILRGQGFSTTELISLAVSVKRTGTNFTALLVVFSMHYFKYTRWLQIFLRRLVL